MAALAEAAAWLRLREVLHQRLAEHRPTDESRLRVQRCVQTLRSAMEQLGPIWNIGLFGSAVNGFDTATSDLDATCYEVEDAANPRGKEDRQSTATSVLKELIPIFEQHNDFKLAREILSARVPILKLRFEDCLDVDLSCLNTEPLQNTRLLRAYAGLNDHVRDLGVAVKLWAKGAQVCGAAHMHLSSYTFTLMALYYMQVDPEVQLPVLPASVFEREDGDPEQDERVKAAQAWSCALPLERLLERFFQFYSHEFYWGSEVASLRRGGRTSSDDPAFSVLRGRRALRLHVEDPCDPTRNLNCVLGEAEELHLQAAFLEAWMAVQQGTPPLGLCPQARLSSQMLLLVDQVAGEPDGLDEVEDALLGVAEEPPEAKPDVSNGSSTRSSASTASGSAASSSSFCSHAGGDEAISSGNEDLAARAGAPTLSKVTLTTMLECSDFEAALLGLQKPQEAAASPPLEAAMSPDLESPLESPALQADSTPEQAAPGSPRSPEEMAELQLPAPEKCHSLQDFMAAMLKPPEVRTLQELEAAMLAAPAEIAGVPEAKPKSLAARRRRMGRMGLRVGNPPAFQ